MKNTEGITWMHVEKTKEIPEEMKNLRQSKKWHRLAKKASEGKKEEYMGQYIAWLNEETEEALKRFELSYFKDRSPYYSNWCNPVARA